jgi:hypothetical protein
MHRVVTRLIVFLLAIGVVQPVSAPAAAPARTGLPQAFLLGSWTGGLFPAPSVISAAQCLAAPTVIFTRDVVMRATFTDAFYIQRMVETALGTGNGVDFRFSPTASPQPSSMPGLAGPGAGGFGCDGPDVLHVQRISADEIRFPGCTDFPYPLVRCPGS